VFALRSSRRQEILQLGGMKGGSGRLQGDQLECRRLFSWNFFAVAPELAWFVFHSKPMASRDAFAPRGVFSGCKEDSYSLAYESVPAIA